ncbi:unnamed protein product [Nesidiocoris tenuis]|uniref:DDE Tnp4 domain-containing protein n=1 Tax=Nesidiocoris tenuis TaxID=355587 RepID=A0A6H5GD92_9HEMI|nr:unnamed protein product [Nesidiocoris tenuis]
MAGLRSSNPNRITTSHIKYWNSGNKNSRSPCKTPKKLSRSAQESSRSACKPRLSPDYAEVCVEDFLELQFGPEPQSVSFGVQVNFEPQDGNREFEFVYDRVSRACAAVQCNIPLDHDFLRPVRLWKTFAENSTPVRCRQRSFRLFLVILDDATLSSSIERVRFASLPDENETWHLVHSSWRFFQHPPQHDDIFWPNRLAVQKELPACFRGTKYENTRVIIDCIEIRPEEPKVTHTHKFLIGITPLGMVSFKSQAYAGRASNNYITNHCGILERLEPGDVVLLRQAIIIKLEERQPLVDKVISASLKRLVTLHLYSDDELTPSLLSVQNYIFSNSNVSLVAMDSIGAHYWQSVAANGKRKIDTYVEDILKQVHQILGAFQVSFVYTRPAAFASKFSGLPPDLSNVWDLRNVNTKVKLKLLKGNTKIAEVHSKMNIHSVSYEICDNGIEWSST